MSEQKLNLKFIHLGSGTEATNNTANAGAIIFEPKSGRIAVQGNSGLEYYGGGRIADATFANSVLTISFNDGKTPAIELDFSDTASASGVNAILKQLRTDVNAIDGRVTTLEGKVATNTSDIAAIKDESTGILAQANSYADGLAKNYDAAGAAAQALVDAKAYTDGKVDGKFDAAGAAAQALVDAKAYTNTEIGKVNTTTEGLRTDVDALKVTVGDASNGLVKKVNDNADAITALQGLHKDKAGETGKMTVADEVTAGVNAKVGDIKLNDTAVTVKEYVDAGDAKALKDAKSYTDTEIGKVNTEAGNLKDRVGALETSVGKSTDAAKADGSVYARIAKNAADIATLVGSDAGKSARKIANEELAAQLIPEHAKESLDTLTEIAAWIQSHPDSASAMNDKITALETTVSDPATGLVKKVNDNVTAINGHTTRIEALEALHDGSKTVATEVSEGIAGIIEHSETNDKENPKTADVVVTVTTKSGSVSGVAVDASILAGKVSDNADAIAAETKRATGAEGGLKTSLDGIRGDLGQTTDASTVTTTAFGRIKALEEKQSSGSLTWFDWQ